MNCFVADYQRYVPLKNIGEMGSCCSSEPPPAGIDGPSRPEQMPLNPKDSVNCAL